MAQLETSSFSGRLGSKSWAVVVVDMATFSAVKELVCRSVFRFSCLVLLRWESGVVSVLTFAVLGCMFEFKHDVWCSQGGFGAYRIHLNTVHH